MAAPADNEDGTSNILYEIKHRRPHNPNRAFRRSLYGLPHPLVLRITEVMALPPLRDLEDRRDVKGGSPRTPSGGVRVSEYQEYVAPIMNGNHVALWKMLASGGWGAAAGILIAYFTAMQSKGVTTKEMQDYDKEYSLFAQQREGIASRNTAQDQQIGVLQGIQQSNIGRLNTHDTKFHDDERDIEDLKGKVKRFGDYIEESYKAKK